MLIWLLSGLQNYAPLNYSVFVFNPRKSTVHFFGHSQLTLNSLQSPLTMNFPSLVMPSAEMNICVQEELL